MTPAIIAPALLFAAIAGAGALLGAVIIWARSRQRRRGRRTAVRGRMSSKGGEPL